jgi:catechol 2,3-dioxygenase-like lactoylglutathione lyase family enzyme
MHMLLGLRTVIYPAPDLDKAKAWYTQALGFGPYFDEPFYVGYSVQGFELGLVPDATPGADGAQALWGVTSVAEALEHLLGICASVI